MKKLFITAMMVACSSLSFAQNPKIDKDVKAAGSYEAGLQVLNSQLATLTAEQKAKGYNALVDIVYPDASKAFEALVTGQQADCMLLVNALNCAVECDKYDNMANDKGKVAPKFSKKNADRLFNFRNPLINAANNTSDNTLKLAYSQCVINTHESSLFAAQLAAGDPVIDYAYFFAAYGCYTTKDYKNAAKYAKMVLNNAELKDNAEDVFSAAVRQNLETRADTLACIEQLKSLKSEKQFALISSLYNALGEKEEAAKLLDETIAMNPNNKMAWAIKGENAMGDRKWDDAIAAFNKTVEIDPEFVEVWFNLGVCASSKGFDLNESLADKQGRLTPDAQAKVTAALQDAKKYYEKVRELDPERERVRNWPYQLRMVYNALGESDKANEISKMLGED